MTHLQKHDMHWALARLPRKLKKLMSDRDWIGLILVGGGYLRSLVAGEKVNDVDVFTKDMKTAELLAYKLAEAKENVKTTENAFTVINPKEMVIQIIHRWTFDSAEKLIDSFDFTCCAAAIYTSLEKVNDKDVCKWHSVCDPDFYPSVASKRLLYRAPQRHEDAGGSMLRVLKYYQKGYRIPVDSLGAVMARLLKGVRQEALERCTEDDLATIITGLLREVDPNIDPFHACHLPGLFGDEINTGEIVENAPVDNTGSEDQPTAPASNQV